MPVLALQLLTSLIVGGLFVAAQLFVVERVPARIAGIVLTLPTTMAISFIFIGWIFGAARIAEIAAINPLTNGVSLLFITTYVYMSARLRGGRRVEMIIAPLAGLGLWLAISMTLAFFEFNDMRLSLLGFAVLATIAHFLLRRLPSGLAVPRKFTIAQNAMRCVISGFVIALTVLLSKVLGPFWGGIFTAFPGANMASLLLLHHEHGRGFLASAAKTMPIGYTSLIVYTLASAWAFPLYGLWWGTLLAYVATAAYLVVLVPLIGRARR